MSTTHTVLRYLRLIHLYVGVFISPALLFFAFTGALQTFSLHETTRGSNYKPPAWAVTLGQIHKKQTPIVPPRRVPPPERPAEKAGHDKTTQEKPDRQDKDRETANPCCRSSIGTRRLAQTIAECNRPQASQRHAV